MAPYTSRPMIAPRGVIQPAARTLKSPSRAKWMEFIGPSLLAGASLVGNLATAQQAQEQSDENNQFRAEQNQADRESAMEIAELNAAASQPYLGFTDPQRVQAMHLQNEDDLNAVKLLIEAYQKALLGK